MFLPRFEKNLAGWPFFWDRFKALVDIDRLTNIEKFDYLLNCLDEDVSDMVKVIMVSNKTYSIEWSVIVERLRSAASIEFVHTNKMLFATALAQ